MTGRKRESKLIMAHDHIDVTGIFSCYCCCCCCCCCILVATFYSSHCHRRRNRYSAREGKVQVSTLTRIESIDSQEGAIEWCMSFSILLFSFIASTLSPFVNTLAMFFVSLCMCVSVCLFLPFPSLLSSCPTHLHLLPPERHICTFVSVGVCIHKLLKSLLLPCIDSSELAHIVTSLLLSLFRPFFLSFSLVSMIYGRLICVTRGGVWIAREKERQRDKEKESSSLEICSFSFLHRVDCPWSLSSSCTMDE